MLDINFIRNNPDAVREGISFKKADSRLVDDFLALDKKWRELVNEIDNLRSEQNKASKNREIEKAKELKEQIKQSEERLKNIEAEREKILRLLPNLPLADVPAGKDESENVVLREVGEKPKFDFKPKDYLELSGKLDLIDIERASKVSGSRFGYLKNQAALLEFALVQFAFEKLVKYGFAPIVPPAMIKEEMMEAMGYVDSEKDKEERYFFEKDKMYFVGTSEQSIGPMHGNETFQEDELPKRYAGFSTCFRREAGSYGKDTKGILRVHQFDKIEMFSFCHPEKSKEEHNLFVKIEEELMQDLKLPYRLVQLCAGDISAPSAATYDIETWMPGQNQYRETHSASNTTDFQARRLNIRYKPLKPNSQNPKPDYVHMLNGTAFAIGRIIIAILENYQQKDGSISAPEILRKYLSFDKISK